jgi:RHS repeat-associated protein
VRQGSDINALVTTVAGNGTPGVSGDGGPARQALVWDPADVKIAPDGSIYFSMIGCVRKITPDGIIHTYAGMCGKGGPSPTTTPVPATSVSFAPDRIALGNDGSLYIQNMYQILRVTPNGMIYVVAGAGGGPPEPNGRPIDGEPAQEATFGDIFSFTVGNDGSIYVSDAYENGGQDIWQVTPDGILHVLDAGTYASAMAISPDGHLVIGTGDFGAAVYELQSTGTWKRIAGGGSTFVNQNPLATNAYIRYIAALAYGPDGSLYIQDGDDFSSLPAFERISSTTGVITYLSGTDVQFKNGVSVNYPGDGGPAAQFSFGGDGFAVNNDGWIYIPGFYFYRLVQIKPILAGGVLGNTTLASSDGKRLYIFDPSGRQLSTVDALTGKNIFTFQYDSTGRLAGITDAEGRETVIQRSSSGVPTAIISPDGQMTSLTVDPNGLLTEVADPGGNTNHMSYYASGLLSTFTDPDGHSDQYTYDSNGLLTKEVNAAGGGWTLSRTEATDGSGAYTVSMTSGAGRTSTFLVQPQPNGDRKQVNTMPDGTVQISTFTQGGLNTVIDPDGTILTTQLGADPRLGIQAPVIQNQTIKLPSGLTSTLAETRTAPLTDLSNPLFGFSQLTDTLDINGQTWTSVFTPTSLTFVSTSPVGRKTTLTVDGLDRPVSVQTGSLAPVSYAYDAAGRLTTLTVGSGSSTRTTQYSYYPSGRSKGYLESVTDPLNRTIGYQYDAAGRPTLETLPDGEQIGFTYYAAGNLTSVTPPGRPAHAFGYTPVNDVATYAPPAVAGLTDTATHYSYNLDRQLTGIALPDGESVSLGYDSGGRLSSVILPTGSYQYNYTATTGQLASLSAPDTENLTYTWDGFLNTGVTWSGPVNGSLSRTFDDNFRVTNLTVDGGAVNYGYDNDGLLTSAGDETISRDAGDGLITGTTLGSLTTSTGYDSFAEPLTRTVSDGSATLYSVSYTRDSVGRITQKIETVNGVTNTWIYGYDQEGRLDAVTENGNPVASYGYDANGNRVSVNAQMIATYDDQDRLLTYGPYSYTYNANGELLTKTSSSGTTSYTWDALGNLLEVKLPNGTDIKYLYDGQNRRIGKEVNGTLTEGFLYDGQLEPVAELDGSGNIVEQFVYGTRPNVPDYIIKGNSIYRVISDQVGSPVLIVDASNGQVAEQISYDAWGNITADSNPGFQPFGFAGGLYDPDTGLVHFGARNYDPLTGRWISKDPILFMGGETSLYGYAGNDPINFIDPSGLYCLSNRAISVISNALAGALAGAAATSETGPGAILGALVGGIGGAIAGYFSADTSADNVASGFVAGATSSSVQYGAGAVGGEVGGLATYGFQKAGAPAAIAVPAGGALGGIAGAATANAIGIEARYAEGGVIGLAAGAVAIGVSSALRAGNDCGCGK